MEHTKFTTVYVANGKPEAEIIKGRLNYEGIPAILKYESLGVVYGLTVDGLGQVEIQVPLHFAKRALEILTMIENTKTET